MEESLSSVTTELPDLRFTGERIVPGQTEEALFREHEERYVFAGQYVFGKDVLDVACGTGVGTEFLRVSGARTVWGLDIDPGAIAFAKARFTECSFAQSDASALCLPDNSLDLVVSFETLEHLTDSRKFLQECQRVLRPDGILICSTPNRALSRWSAENPYHVREFYPSEFKALLESMFVCIELFGQRTRAILAYAPRKIARRVLQYMQLSRSIDKLLARKPNAAPLPVTFIDDLSMRRNISVYRPNVLHQPMFLLAVAHKRKA